MAAEPTDALIGAADELYALPPEDFTAARNARAKAAQADGDRDLAGAIRGLPKPSAAAWLANQLVRRDRSALEPLLALGAELRAATAELDGAAMRTLSRQQPKLVAALVRRAAELAQSSGKPVSQGVARDLEDTLRAAIADADAADQLMSGRLANALQHNGFGLVEAGNLSLVKNAPATVTRERVEPATTTATTEQRRAERLEAAERAVADAEAAVEVTSAGQSRATAELDDAERALETAKEALAQLREELDRAKFALSRAEGELRQSKQGLEQANRAARAAANGLADATAKRDSLNR